MGGSRRGGVWERGGGAEVGGVGRGRVVWSEDCGGRGGGAVGWGGEEMWGVGVVVGGGGGGTQVEGGVAHGWLGGGWVREGGGWSGGVGRLSSRVGLLPGLGERGERRCARQGFASAGGVGVRERSVRQSVRYAMARGGAGWWSRCT
ncbi:hypothetical protein CesoFtcFv8_023712 [Champsocephalus esox]|uniref:Uncharacterized protein n=1 Tax=Champsocephalus esox TaxID=159716 RepID=A0AAN8B4U6_9TELE|nr:hypothetical protein CesoFtcFv8_023712 [Champsocephalus esox]